MIRHANHPRWYRVIRPLTTVVLHARRSAFLRLETIDSRAHVEHLGSAYGGWSVATDLLAQHSICYSAGIGEDVTFDTELIRRFRCDVHAFDPVPKAFEFARRELDGEPRFHVYPFGLWSDDRRLTFYAPEYDGWVSHSAVDFRHTPASFEASVRSVASLMEELGHDHLDLLKLSVEGAEYGVLDSVLRARLDISQVLVEFTPPVPLSKVRRAVRRLREGGYGLAAAPIKPWGWKCTFVRRELW